MDARRLKKHGELKPLRVAILRNGKRVGLTEIPDPRVAFLAMFNERGKSHGLSAKPA